MKNKTYTQVKNNLNINLAKHYCVKCEKGVDDVDFEGKCYDCANN